MGVQHLVHSHLQVTPTIWLCWLWRLAFQASAGIVISLDAHTAVQKKALVCARTPPWGLPAIPFLFVSVGREDRYLPKPLMSLYLPTLSSTPTCPQPPQSPKGPCLIARGFPELAKKHHYQLKACSFVNSTKVLIQYFSFYASPPARYCDTHPCKMIFYNCCLFKEWTI